MAIEEDPTRGSEPARFFMLATPALLVGGLRAAGAAQLGAKTQGIQARFCAQKNCGMNRDDQGLASVCIATIITLAAARRHRGARLLI